MTAAFARLFAPVLAPGGCAACGPARFEDCRANIARGGAALCHPLPRLRRVCAACGETEHRRIGRRWMCMQCGRML
jgi:hypothetical protein